MLTPKVARLSRLLHPPLHVTLTFLCFNPILVTRNRCLTLALAAANTLRIEQPLIALLNVLKTRAVSPNRPIRRIRLLHPFVVPRLLIQL